MASRARFREEAGFSILECTIALSVVFVVLLGLLGSLTAGARGVVTGRQRSAALALANEVMEDARGRAYGDVGHDFDSDPTLAADPLITGTAPNFVYTGVSPAEPLAASSVNAGASGGTVDNPLYPFSPHTFTSKREQTVYTTQVYVTTVTPGVGDAYKRITVKIAWAPSLYASAARAVTLSSFLFNAGAPPDPELTGTGEADAGSFKVTGTLAGISLSDGSLTLPYVNGSIDSGFIRSAKGLARSGSSEVNLLSGLLSGCSVDGLSSSCDPALAQADADNDSGTAPPDTDQAGPVSAASAAIDASGLGAALGSGTARAQASARSCWACQPGGTPPVGDDDRLPYFAGTATGPANAAVTFTTVGPGVSGSLFSIGTGCSANCAAVTIDRDDSGNNPRLSSTASVSFPALSLMTFAAGAPAGYSGMVKFGAVSATATAGSGPGATAPTVTGTAVAVQMWDTATGGYKTVNVTPGAAPPASDPTAHAAFSIGSTSVVMDATLHWNKAVTSQTNSGGAVSDAAASLTNWLFVDLHVTMTTASGPVADLNLHFDYGRIAATAGYQPAP
jgi:type II secretory pathway pseudopilin PulG